MNRQRNRMLMALMLISCVLLTAQDLSVIMGKVIDTYATMDNYQMTMDYTLYSNGQSNIVKDELKGEVIKEGENYYTKMKETEMVFTNGFMLKISHPEKIMLYSKLKTSINDLIKQQNPFMEFSKQFEDSKIENKGDYFICTFNKATNARMPYNKIVLYVSKEDHIISKQIYFFKTSVEKQFNREAKETENERLEVVLTSFKKKISIDADLFSLDRYLTKVGESTYKASSYIKDYQILTQ